MGCLKLAYYENRSPLKVGHRCFEVTEKSYTSGYRFGFNGQERAAEVYGIGNLNTALFWEYDTRLGRRWNVDPIVYADISSYSCFRNNPLVYIDEKGDNPKPEILGTKKEADKQVTRETRVRNKDEVYNYEGSWYFHNGTTQIGTTYEKGWYNSSEYKQILTGTNENTTPVFNLNVRMLASDILGIKAVITEKNLSVDELIALAKIAKNAMNRGCNLIEYQDYKTTGTGDPYTDVAENSAKKSYGAGYGEIVSKQNNPNYVLKTTLGQATILKVNDNSLMISDMYDFNDANKARDKPILSVIGDFFKGMYKAGFHLYKQVRNLCTYLGSKLGEGIPIEVKTPSILLK